VQTQSLEDTLAAYTRDGAYAEFQEGVKGELRRGLLADLVLLTGDLENTSVAEVGQMSAALTISGGHVVYEA
jgi:predicted amidohydrolase YtcJ